jgi:cobalt/nickel transport system permease protein
MRCNSNNHVSIAQLATSREDEMHIPDGYISPATAVILYGAAVPFWWRASTVIKKTLASQAAPTLAIMAAFVFTIQMFNVPVPGGTTAHAVGGTLAAVVLGPWAAVIAVTVALIIQALFFGDGGITAIGANSFNMAVALPFVGYGVYRALAGNAPLASRRRVIAAAIGSYFGINTAGLLLAIQLGIQPIFWSEGGRALYNPYGLEVALPTVMLVHLTIAGFAEMIATALVVLYLQRNHLHLLAPYSGSTDTVQVRRNPVGRTIVVGALVIMLTPLGLLASGDAWGEWAPETVQELVGYVPAGMESLGETWQLAPLPDYQRPDAAEDAGFFSQAIEYVLSAIIGVALVMFSAFGIKIVLGGSGRRGASPGGRAPDPRGA